MINHTMSGLFYCPGRLGCGFMVKVSAHCGRVTIC